VVRVGQGEVRVNIASDADIVTARLQGRSIAERIGFTGSDLVIIATAISEVARNIVEYAERGEVILSNSRQGGRIGMTIIARDTGPGIADVQLALQGGYSSGRGLGLGLPGARRLMDEFDIVSRPGKGTKVTMRKWLR
jgi:serine/threonine-protein kinase RsbT